MAKKAAKKTEDKNLNKNKKEENVKVEDKINSSSEEITDEDKTAEKQSDDQTNKELEKLNSEIEELKNKLEAAENSSKTLNDKFLRLTAEYDNYRKRTTKEKADLTKLANSDLLKDFLPVVDDLERGMNHIDSSEDMDSLKEGINLIYTKFVEFLRQNGVKEIEAKEKEFDIDFHEALTKIPAPSEELKGKVVDVIEKGYLLNDKVIRYAKVVVGE